MNQQPHGILLKLAFLKNVKDFQVDISGEVLIRYPHVQTTTLTCFTDYFCIAKY